jgi:hypothetical protein
VSPSDRLEDLGEHLGGEPRLQQGQRLGSLRRGSAPLALLRDL